MSHHAGSGADQYDTYVVFGLASRPWIERKDRFLSRRLQFRLSRSRAVSGESDNNVSKIAQSCD